MSGLLMVGMNVCNVTLFFLFGITIKGLVCEIYNKLAKKNNKSYKIKQNRIVVF